MDEAQRIAYLKHMGVEQYYPRYVLVERKSLSFLLQHKTFMTLRFSAVACEDTTGRAAAQ